jgi:hypothetical protein
MLKQFGRRNVFGIALIIPNVGFWSDMERRKGVENVPDEHSGSLSVTEDVTVHVVARVGRPEAWTSIKSRGVLLNPPHSDKFNMRVKASGASRRFGCLLAAASK